MSAPDRANDGNRVPPLYHGSGQIMKPGSIIKPGAEGVTFASSHRDDAATFATANQDRTVANQTGQAKPEWKQMAMFNPVYSVEAIDKKGRTPGYHGIPEFHASKKGFRVKGVHSWTSKGEKLTDSPSVVERNKKRREASKKDSGI